MHNNEPVTFVTFVGDLVSYALKEILQVEYKFPHQKTAHRKTFHETIGEAATVFRKRHADQFGEMMADAGTFVVADVRSVIDYFEEFVEGHFKGKVPLMELIIFCAFLIDVVVCCTENDRMDLIDDVVSETYDVYDEHVRPYFDVAGGWLSLLRVARDYLCYVESMRKYSLRSAEEKKNDGKDNKDGCAIDAYMLCSKSTQLTNNVQPVAKNYSVPFADIKSETSRSIQLFKELDSEYIKKISTHAPKSDSEMSTSSNDTDDCPNKTTLVNSQFVTKSSKRYHAVSSNDTDDSTPQAMSSNYTSEIETTDTD